MAGHPHTTHAAPVGTAEDPSPVIELIDVTKMYRNGSIEVAALTDVSARIVDNEFVAIVGPSGSGKSTLMHILGCLDVPTSGVFRLMGHDVQSFDEDRLADVRNLFIGFVFQQFNLLGYLPAWRNVELPLVYGGVPPCAIAGSGPWRPWTRWAWPAGRTTAPVSCPGASSSGWPSPGRWSPRRLMILADEPTGNLDSTSSAGGARPVGPPPRRGPHDRPDHPRSSRWPAG